MPHYFPPFPPKPFCPECEKRNIREFDKYGFNIVKDGKYWTLVKEVKSCCPIKVKVIDAMSNKVSFIVVDDSSKKVYTKDRIDFLTSSWRDYDAY